MHILIAPNAFKNSLGASQAAEAIQEGLRQSRLICTTECFPIADGGDGTSNLIIKKGRGTIVSTEVQNPLGRKINCSYGVIDDEKTAVIEMADASGLRLLKNDELDPLRASTFGTGQLIKSALTRGIRKIIIGMGGSATVDGGTGILKALGVRFKNNNNEELINIPESLKNLESIDISALDPLVYDCDITVLCDVDNKLLGSSGAAAVFGPQKGANAEDVKKLELSLSRFRDVVFKETGKDIGAVKFGGTAGGAAAGLYAILNANLVNGADYFLKLTNFKESVERADLVITAEGSIDEQTLQGKGPFKVVQFAREKGIPVIGLAGIVPLKASPLLKSSFDALFAIGNGPTDVATAMLHTTENLIRLSREIGNFLALQKQLFHSYP